ncbi:serine hydrolase [Flavobacterium aciduliphilum]|uniref:CubicO group peptidase (Beta-lactamase class C family) n=1 Tax=Flavobacterium aciduliphilum TaxID=1101402 RepID=A0A328YT18_9FLAO|nr:serine hydrolase [Flavobacterium aciduliphilum]RAR75322.1 CubicO group peptidase (beta-lactamase class C family) [Flavobacterium aciduliphilum]
MQKQFFLTVMILVSCGVFSQIKEDQVDAVVNQTMKTFNVPGIAVAIIKDGKVVLSKGYGVLNIKTQQKVDGNTLFGIASNSKAFTAAALGMLVDEKKLQWDDKVITYIPEFKMYNDYVTQEFTIRDLLTHRSGLGLGAGDLMIWPDGHDFTPKDIIANIHFLKPVSAFRTKYDYDNLLYVIAGEVIARVSGMSWCDFIESRIMKPIGMTHSAASFKRLKDTSNCIAPHVPTQGKLEVIQRYTNPIFDAAAGIYTSTNDLSQWVLTQLNKGKYGTESLFSEKVHKEMWTPQTILPNNGFKTYTCNFKAYGLGWQLTDINGHLQVSHTGGLDGIVTQTIMIPALQLGIIVLTNQQSGAAFTAISNTIKDSYLGLPYKDHVALLSEDRKQKEDQADKITDEVWAKVKENESKKGTQEHTKICGTYTDNWFGAIVISQKKGVYRLASVRSPRLCGTLHFYKDATFAVQWDHASFHADAFVKMEYAPNGTVNRITMEAISPLTDFSYDFQDLDFRKVKD